MRTLQSFFWPIYWARYGHWCIADIAYSAQGPPREFVVLKFSEDLEGIRAAINAGVRWNTSLIYQRFHTNSLSVRPLPDFFHLRIRAFRSLWDMPPQMPCCSSLSRASIRHIFLTGHSEDPSFPKQIAFALSAIGLYRARSLGGKKISVSIPEHLA